MGRTCRTYGVEKRYTEFQCRNLKGRTLGRPRLRREDIIKMDIREVEWEGMDRWLRVEPGVELLRMQQYNLEFHKCGKFINWVRNC